VSLGACLSRVKRIGLRGIYKGQKQEESLLTYKKGFSGSLL
jgi:hypothetical protein